MKNRFFGLWNAHAGRQADNNFDDPPNANANANSEQTDSL